MTLQIIPRSFQFLLRIEEIFLFFPPHLSFPLSHGHATHNVIEHMIGIHASIAIHPEHKNIYSIFYICSCEEDE